jgi:predicted lipoprotein with Yx(FWY)xxD motif
MQQLRSRLLPALLGGSVLIAGLVTFAVSPAHAKSHVFARSAAPVKAKAAHILVTSKGRTLYVFALDSKNKSACTGTCAKFWPPRTVAKGVTPPAKMAGIPGTFGVFTRSDGTRQLTYDGAPLYTFLEDKKAGDMNGQGIVASGGYWWAVVAGGK